VVQISALRQVRQHLREKLRQFDLKQFDKALEKAIKG